MDFLPESVSKLINELAKLPGVGPKSAQRLGFYLLKRPEAHNQVLGEAVANVRVGVQACGRCHTLASQNPCPICEDLGRDASVLCVVEGTMDMIALEKTGGYKGLYHVLNGKISPLDGVGPDDLTIASLLRRVREEQIEEVILATNPDLEGETTALYLQKQLMSLPVKVSRIARGLPSGGNLEYSDEATLIRAMEGRQHLS